MPRGRRGGWLRVGASVAAGLLVACAHGRQHQRHVFRDDRDSVQVISAQIGGKNVYIPSTLVLSAGDGRVLSLYNTTEAPHGFEIPGLGVQVILPPGEELRVELPPLEAHRIYAIRCQLHPPHRHASLVVVP